jgi:hypothetical protein
MTEQGDLTERCEKLAAKLRDINCRKERWLNLEIRKGRKKGS